MQIRIAPFVVLVAITLASTALPASPLIVAAASIPQEEPVPYAGREPFSILPPEEAAIRAVPAGAVAERTRYELPILAVGARPGDVVADIGCGDGPHVVELARLVGEDGLVVCRDPSASVEDVHDRATEAGIANVDVARSMPCDVGIPPETVDVALLADVYQFVLRQDETRAAFLDSLHACLRPGGVVVVVYTKSAHLFDADRRAEVFAATLRDFTGHGFLPGRRYVLDVGEERPVEILEFGRVADEPEEEADRTEPATDAEPDIGEQIDAVFESWDRDDAPGAAVAVTRDGEIVHAAGYGLAQLEYGVPIEADTIFHVASVSKQFTAMAVVLLALEGRLSLDDEVRAHVPEVPDFGTPITLRHVLNHTSGMRDQWESLAIAGWRLDDVITREHVLSVVQRQRELNFQPGERYMYCNTGYTLAAETVARVSGVSFKDFTSERIFGPLGMTRTHFHDDHRHVVPDRAYSYGPDGDGFQKSVLSYANVGATSLFTTAPDLCRWLENFDHGRVGGAEALALLRTCGRLSDGSEIPSRYALGVMLSEHEGHEVVQHAGGDAGFRSFVAWFPAHRLGVAVVSNHASLPVAPKAYEVADLFLPQPDPRPDPHGEHDEGDPAAGGGEPDPHEAPGTIDLDEDLLERLEGRYAMPNGFPCEVTTRRGSLFARVGRQPRRRLRPDSATEFHTTVGEVRLVFPEGSGPAAELVLRTPEGESSFQRVEGEPPALDLSSYAGEYVCPELATTYELVVEGDELVARHFRHGRIPLRPMWPDVFTGRQWFFSRLELTRDEGGRVDGFLLQGSRVLNLRFDRR